MLSSQLKAGQTLVLLGPVETEAHCEITGIPVWSEIPLLGHFFTSQRSYEIETVPLVALTAEVISSQAAVAAPGLRENVPATILPASAESCDSPRDTMPSGLREEVQRLRQEVRVLREQIEQRQP